MQESLILHWRSSAWCHQQLHLVLQESSLLLPQGYSLTTQLTKSLWTAVILQLMLSVSSFLKSSLAYQLCIFVMPPSNSNRNVMVVTRSSSTPWANSWEVICRCDFDTRASTSSVCISFTPTSTEDQVTECFSRLPSDKTTVRHFWLFNNTVRTFILGSRRSLSFVFFLYQ